ncbi:hypothetical protein KY290_014347 [Solanum tuberosum]|uniref:Peptidase S8/S53 domain-containing protein n=1 Tax=Solanum tuberosum TaxID=4113 RepID=A0ABQ7VPC1_SOLTU|nr:hypothetical protein KY290_014347 [Solanum tuberosum]
MGVRIQPIIPASATGHGTHTAGTVGGRRVANVSAIGGFAKGTATIKYVGQFQIRV